MIRKTVLITGGCGGIGSATAIKFARNGYNVALTYNTTDPKKTENLIKSFGVDCFSVQMNILKEDDVKKAFSEVISRFGVIDCVVCNAGIAEKEFMLIDKNYDEISNVIDVNLKGTILCNREASKYFINLKKGSIVNISSILGVNGCACEVVYSASKSGIIGLTKALSKEVGQFGVRVNAVAPGMILTKMTEGFSEAEKEEIRCATSLKRLGEAEDVANAVYFLATDDASFITGECITVSGGLLI